MFSNTAGCSTRMFIRPTSTRPAQQEIMARRAKFCPSDPLLIQSGEEIGRTSSLSSMYFATDLKKRRDSCYSQRSVLCFLINTSIPNQTASGVVHNDACRIEQRHCHEEGSRFLWEHAGAFHPDDSLELPQRRALGLFLHCYCASPRDPETHQRE